MAVFLLWVTTLDTGEAGAVARWVRRKVRGAGGASPVAEESRAEEPARRDERQERPGTEESDGPGRRFGRLRLPRLRRWRLPRTDAIRRMLDSVRSVLRRSRRMLGRLARRLLLRRVPFSADSYRSGDASSDDRSSDAQTRAIAAAHVHHRHRRDARADEADILHDDERLERMQTIGIGTRQRLKHFV